MQKQISTITFFRYEGFRERFWAISQMQRAIQPLLAQPGLDFFKLMGTGAGGGFSLKPDFSVYCLLQVWTDEAAADSFFADSAIYRLFVEHSVEQWTLFTHPLRVKGLWSGQQPFRVWEGLPPGKTRIVLTRASIRWQKLIDFWRHVPATSRAIEGARGLLFSKGVGELPFIRQATISIWEEEGAMRQFAYQDQAHREVIQKTVARKWYKEELFAAFYPYRTTGGWNGSNPLNFGEKG